MSDIVSGTHLEISYAPKFICGRKLMNVKFGSHLGLRQWDWHVTPCSKALFTEYFQKTVAAGNSKLYSENTNRVCLVLELE